MNNYSSVIHYLRNLFLYHNFYFSLDCRLFFRYIYETDIFAE
jgi:hypothetical protein